MHMQHRPCHQRGPGPSKSCLIVWLACLAGCGMHACGSKPPASHCARVPVMMGARAALAWRQPRWPPCWSCPAIHPCACGRALPFAPRWLACLLGCVGAHMPRMGRSTLPPSGQHAGPTMHATAAPEPPGRGAHHGMAWWWWVHGAPGPAGYARIAPQRLRAKSVSQSGRWAGMCPPMQACPDRLHAWWFWKQGYGHPPKGRVTMLMTGSTNHACMQMQRRRTEAASCTRLLHLVAKHRTTGSLAVAAG